MFLGILVFLPSPLVSADDQWQSLFTDSALIRQAKMNTQMIQVAIERYNQEKGYYPEFLIGGDDGFFFELEYLGKLKDGEAPVDPLIGEGYLGDYPLNPFAVVALSGSQVFPNPVTLWQDAHKDPYRVQGEVQGINYRFGTLSLTMGNVMADPRYAPTSFGYPAWNVEDLPWSERVRLAGNFFYKSFTPEGAEHPTGYILAVYGPPGWLGQDVIGIAPAGLEKYASSPDGSGCPFSYAEDGRIAFGNPDGDRDGLMMVLTGGNL